MVAASEEFDAPLPVGSAGVTDEDPVGEGGGVAETDPADDAVPLGAADRTEDPGPGCAPDVQALTISATPAAARAARYRMVRIFHPFPPRRLTNHGGRAASYSGGLVTETAGDQATRLDERREALRRRLLVEPRRRAGHRQ